MDRLPPLLLVLAGGGVGAVLRWWAVGAVRAGAGDGFPWGTLAVNVGGGLAIGLLAALVADRPAGPAWLLLGVGLLGGFTTFSAFALELHALLARGAVAAALGYALASNLGAVAGVALGLRLAR